MKVGMFVLQFFHCQYGTSRDDIWNCAGKSLGMGVIVGFAPVVVFVPGPTVFHGLNIGFAFWVFAIDVFPELPQLLCLLLQP